MLRFRFGRDSPEPDGIHETGHRVFRQEVACQRGELAAGIVRVRVPLLDRTKPRVMVLGQRAEGVDESVARLRAELSNHRAHEEEVGMALGVQKKSPQGVSGITFERCERCGDRDEVRLGDVRGSQFLASDLQDRRSGMACLVFPPGRSGLEILLQRKVPFLAPLVPVFLDTNAESVPGAPLHVLLDAVESQRRQVLFKLVVVQVG